MSAEVGFAVLYRFMHPEEFPGKTQFEGEQVYSKFGGNPVTLSNVISTKGTTVGPKKGISTIVSRGTTTVITSS